MPTINQAFEGIFYANCEGIDELENCKGELRKFFNDGIEFVYNQLLVIVNNRDPNAIMLELGRLMGELECNFELIRKDLFKTGKEDEDADNEGAI